MKRLKFTQTRLARSVSVIMFIFLATGIFTDGLPVAAAPWSGSTTDIESYTSVIEGGAHNVCHYEGKKDGYETWSARTGSGTYYFGKVTLNVYSTDLRPTSSGTHLYRIKIYLNGHISDTYICDNHLKVTLRLCRSGGSTVVTWSETYTSCDDGVHDKYVMLYGYATLVGGADYYAHVTFSLYSGIVLFYGVESVDFMYYPNDYLQFIKLYLAEI